MHKDILRYNVYRMGRLSLVELSAAIANHNKVLTEHQVSNYITLSSSGDVRMKARETLIASMDAQVEQVAPAVFMMTS